MYGTNKFCSKPNKYTSNLIYLTSKIYIILYIHNRDIQRQLVNNKLGL